MCGCMCGKVLGYVYIRMKMCVYIGTMAGVFCDCKACVNVPVG